MLKLLKLALVLTLCCAYAMSARAEHNSEQAWLDYHWGRGLNLPALNLNIGGYFKASYVREELSPDKFSVNDLSVFITWSPFDRLRFFAEVEQHNWLSNEGVSRFNETLSVERLFVDVLLSESSTLRFGKYLTPVGRWNVIHSAPLVWTTNRPVLTDDRSYAPRANGVLLTHSHLVNEHNLDITLYLDDSTDLEIKSRNNIVFDRAAGARVNYELTEHLQIGSSYLAYQKLSDMALADLNSPDDAPLPWHHLIGIDALWQHNGYEVLFESHYHLRDDPKHILDEKSLFIQGVAPLVAQVSAVARYEYFNSSIFRPLLQDTVAHIGVTGLAWRPFLPMVLKAEYRFGSGNQIIAPSGFYLSIATFY